VEINNEIKLVNAICEFLQGLMAFFRELAQKP